MPYAKEFTHNGLGQHFKFEDKTIANTENPIMHFIDGISVNLAKNIVSNEDYAFNYLFSKCKCKCKVSYQPTPSPSSINCEGRCNEWVKNNCGFAMNEEYEGDNRCINSDRRKLADFLPPLDTYNKQYDVLNIKNQVEYHSTMADMYYKLMLQLEKREE